MDSTAASGNNGSYSLELTRRLGDGRLTQRREMIGGRRLRISYGYDSAGRLAYAAWQGRGSEVYEYDREGRRKRDRNLLRGMAAREFLYDWDNRLLSAAGSRFEHDEHGFRSARLEPDGRITRYHYAPAGELLAVELPDGRFIEYSYNASGRRVSKSVDGRLAEIYRWAGSSRLVGFQDSRWTMNFRYGTGRLPLSMECGGQPYVLYFDQAGTLRAVSHVSGRLIQVRTSDTFGNLLGLSGPELHIPFGFGGGLFDPDTGLTRLGSREYDADTGRFTAASPPGAETPEAGCCCLDDPVNRAVPAEQPGRVRPGRKRRSGGRDLGPGRPAGD